MYAFLLNPLPNDASMTSQCLHLTFSRGRDRVVLLCEWGRRLTCTQKKKGKMASALVVKMDAQPFFWFAHSQTKHATYLMNVDLYPH